MAGRSRVVSYYAVLLVLTAAVVTTVIVSGRGRRAEPAVAGGYDLSAPSPCLGAKFDLQQSGRYVSISSTQGSLSGDLTLRRGRLTGTVGCLAGPHAVITARFREGMLTGTIGGAALSALLKRDPPPAGSPKLIVPARIAGPYALVPSSDCLGASMMLAGSASRLKLITGHKLRGTVAYRDGALAGTIVCDHGGTRALHGIAAGRAIDVMLTAGGGGAGAAAGAAGPSAEHLQATKVRSADDTVVAFFAAAVLVMLLARLCGSVMPKIGQPRVMGEVLAGIMLGPTVFGAIDPTLQARVFSSDVVPYIGVAANLGLVFYMFLIGLEVDFAQLRGRLATTLAISNTGLAVPMMLGMAAALPLYTVLAPNTRFVAFAVFIGVSMSVTAFPVLARIISERGMLKRPVGALALSAAAVDDVSAWFLIALATAVAGTGTGLDVAVTIALTAAFVVGMVLVVRPALARAAIAYDEAGRLPGTWLTIIFTGVLLSSVITQQIGVAIIIGAFVMGLVMPRHAGLSHEVTERVEDFVLTLLLPLFFAYTGLRTDIGQLGRSQLILITLGLVAVAIAGKFGGSVIAARTMKLPWRESAAIGALMNTRGLTELIVLNLALDKGVITPALFTSLVVMALVTTFMTGPLMRLIDPRNTFGAPPEDELAAAPRLVVEAAPAPASSILVAPQSDGALEPLLSLAAPLASVDPPRELILARLVAPPRGSSIRGGLQTEAHEVREASDALQRERLTLLDHGITSRAVAIASANPGRDISRLSSSEEVDLVLLDGRRPLLGDGIPREDVGAVLQSAPCDVAVLVAREGAQVALAPGSLVMVPFGGAEHDWAALELGAWLCASTGASLELLGPSGRSADGKDSSHMLANATLLVQQYAGVAAVGTVADPGREGIVAAASRASLLVVGLSERWRKEGLGDVRREIARSAPAPIVFVRRGERPGALAPATDATRFAWSSAGVGAPRDFSRAFSRAFSAVNLPGLGTPPAAGPDPAARSAPPAPPPGPAEPPDG